MRAQNSIRWVVAVFGALVILIWAYLRSGDDRAAPTAASSSSAESTQDKTPERLEGNDPLVPAKVAVGESRVRAPLQIQIVSTARAPIAGATLSWTPVSPGWVSDPDEPSDDERTRARAATRTFVSDDQGLVQLSDLPPELLEQPAVLWVTHPDHRAAFTVPSLDVGALRVPPEIELEPAGRLIAHVRATDGTPATGATVVETFDFYDTHGLTGFGPDWAAKRIFQCVGESDASGTIVLAPTGGPTRVEASLGSFRSRPWQGRAPAEVVLDLATTCSVSGTVLVEGDAHLGGETQVACLAQRGGVPTGLSRLAVDADGRFGPTNLPIVPADEYIFSLQGGDLVQSEVSRAIPHAGEQVTLELHARRGLALTVQVSGEGDKRLAGATVHVQWNDERVWQTLSRKTDAEGIARFRGCLPGTLWVRARCPGYVPKLVDGFDWNASNSRTIVVELPHAGRIAGRCTHGGAPPGDFTIMYWKGNVDTATNWPVKGSSDGRFTIDEAPIGEVTLMALSEVHCRSEPVQVTTSEDGTAEVELVLPDSLHGTGRVVDALTSEPIPDASVQVFSMYRHIKMRPFRGVQPATSDGRFEIDGLNSGSNMIEVSSPRHAARQIFATGIPGQPVDFGLVGLFARQSIEVQLVSSSPEDWTGYIAELNGPDYVGEKHFSSDGRMLYRDLMPSTYMVRVICPDQSVFLEDIVLRPGKDVRVDIPIAGRSLDVEIVLGAGGPEHPAAYLGAYFTNAHGRTTKQYYVVPPDNRVHLARVDGTQAMLSAEDQAQAVLALKHLVLSSLAPGGVRMELESRRRVFQVVDKDSSPVQDAYVFLKSSEDASGWMQTLTTDIRGECSTASVPFDSVLMCVHHLTLGTQPGQLVGVRESDPNPIRIVLAPDLDLCVRAVERGSPVPALELAAQDEHGFNGGLRSTTTDTEGKTCWRPVGKGSYRITVRHPGYWPTEMAVRVDGKMPPSLIEVRRLGNVEIAFENAYGAPLRDALVDLYSLEMKEWVSRWIESGAAPGDRARTTNEEGKVRFDGLPNGAYRWRVSANGIEPAEGSVDVPAQSTAVVQARLH